MLAGLARAGYGINLVEVDGGRKKRLEPSTHLPTGLYFRLGGGAVARWGALVNQKGWGQLYEKP